MSQRRVWDTTPLLSVIDTERFGARERPLVELLSGGASVQRLKARSLQVVSANGEVRMATAKYNDARTQRRMAKAILGMERAKIRASMAKRIRELEPEAWFNWRFWGREARVQARVAAEFPLKIRDEEKAKTRGSLAGLAWIAAFFCCAAGAIAGMTAFAVAGGLTFNWLRFRRNSATDVRAEFQDLFRGCFFELLPKDRDLAEQTLAGGPGQLDALLRTAMDRAGMLIRSEYNLTDAQIAAIVGD
jgi:hypothetical protein